jgi:pantetheine-phosphate adenylyltransferase
MMSKCFFPGSFDPFTLGHQNIIEKVSSITDSLVIGIGNHHDKNSLLDIKIRKKLIRDSIDALVIKNLKIDIIVFDCLLIDAAKNNNCNLIVRGIRDTSDLNYELRMYNTNRKMSKNIETFFMATDNNLNHISSSLVRQIYKLGGKIDYLVPSTVNKYLISNINSITKNI